MEVKGVQFWGLKKGRDKAERREERKSSEL